MKTFLLTIVAGAAALVAGSAIPDSGVSTFDPHYRSSKHSFEEVIRSFPLTADSGINVCGLCRQLHYRQPMLLRTMCETGLWNQRRVSGYGLNAYFSGRMNLSFSVV